MQQARNLRLVTDLCLLQCVNYIAVLWNVADFRFGVHKQNWPISVAHRAGPRSPTSHRRPRSSAAIPAIFLRPQTMHHNGTRMLRIVRDDRFAEIPVTEADDCSWPRLCKNVKMFYK